MIPVVKRVELIPQANLIIHLGCNHSYWISRPGSVIQTSSKDYGGIECTLQKNPRGEIPNDPSNEASGVDSPGEIFTWDVITLTGYPDQAVLSSLEANVVLILIENKDLKMAPTWRPSSPFRQPDDFQLG